MNYIIFDLEWNQPLSPKKMRKGLAGEIIQIGAVKMDENLDIVDIFKVLVMPKHYTRMHESVEELTGIKTYDLQCGVPFPKAINLFRSWCGQDAVFLTWSPNDMPMLLSNLRLHELDEAWTTTFYDVQKIYCKDIANSGRRASLENACEALGESVFKAHDALHDALNTAAVCKHLDLVGWIENHVPDETAIAARTLGENQATGFFINRRAALQDKEMRYYVCPICHKQVVFRDWINQNNFKKISIAACPSGKAYFARLKFIKCDGGVRANRSIYELSDDLKSYYNEKAELSGFPLCQVS